MNGGSMDRPPIRFGSFELDLEVGELRKSGVLAHLPPQPARVLALLASRAGQLVTREEIRQEVWGDGTFIDFEQGLNHCVKQIRTALGDDADVPRYVQTLPRRGYRFIAPVQSGGAPLSCAVMEQPPVLEAAVAEAPSRRPPWLWKVALPLFAAAFAGVFLILNVGSVRSRLWPGRTFPRITSIAVLPLENLSHDPEQEYFADGMTEALITDLGKIGALRVTSRQSVMRYKGSTTPLPAIARELNVDAIVEGAVQRSGDRIRITAQLLHGKSDRHLWAESYERDFRDVLRLQTEVARAVAGEIRIAVTPEERKRLEESRQVEPEAYRLFLQGRYQFSKRTLPAFDKSIQLFREALEKDPSSALAYAGLAESYGILPFYSSAAPNIAFPRAREAAQKALQIDGSLAEAHAALGFVLLYYEWDWPAAERELKQALRLKPSYAVGHHWYAEHLSAMGRHEEAIVEIRHAQELDPLSPLMQAIGGEVFFYARRYDDVIEHARKAIFLDPYFPLGYSWLAHALSLKGRQEEAIEAAEKLERIAGEELAADVAYLYAKVGRRTHALSAIDENRGRNKRKGIPSSWVADVHLCLGERELALDWLEKAFAERDPYMAFLNVNPKWDALRPTLRFQDLLRRMKFPS